MLSQSDKEKETDMPHIIRQGDVLLLPVAKAPAKRVPVEAENGRVVLAHGEATGHHHSFALSDRVALFREDGSGGGLFLSVSGAALAVPPGDYKVIRQRTYEAGMARRVED